jgi:hypothetical protein
MGKRAKRMGRPPGKEPPRVVVSARVAPPLYDKLKESARAAGRTLGEELIGRVQRSFEWEQQFGEARAVLAEANETAAQVTKQSLQAAMRQAGYTQVRGINGSAWFEPGVASIQWIADSLPRDLLDELFKRAGLAALKAQEEERKTRLRRQEGSREQAARKAADEEERS